MTDINGTPESETEELKFYYRGDTAIVQHKATGISVECNNYGSKFANKQGALSVLSEVLERLEGFRENLKDG